MAHTITILESTVTVDHWQAQRLQRLNACTLDWQDHFSRDYELACRKCRTVEEAELLGELAYRHGVAWILNPLEHRNDPKWSLAWSRGHDKARCRSLRADQRHDLAEQIENAEGLGYCVPA